jgi:hypothetical protein
MQAESKINRTVDLNMLNEEIEKATKLDSSPAKLTNLNDSDNIDIDDDTEEKEEQITQTKTTQEKENKDA